MNGVALAIAAVCAAGAIPTSTQVFNAARGAELGRVEGDFLSRRANTTGDIALDLFTDVDDRSSAFTRPRAALHIGWSQRVGSGRPAVKPRARSQHAGVADDDARLGARRGVL